MSASTIPLEDGFDDLLHMPSTPEAYAFVPAELRALPIWLTFTLEPKKDDPDRMNKIPHNARTGYKANDPKLGVTIWEAIAAKEKYSHAGIGYYVEPPYVVCDQDRCVDPKTDTITQQAIDIVSELNSWTYLSTSRTGLHTVVKGEKPGDRCRKGIELYSTRHFMALGSPVGGVPETIQERDLTSLYGRMVAGSLVEPTKAPETTAPTASNPVTNESVQIQNPSGHITTTKYELFMRGDIAGDKPFTISDDRRNSLTYEDRSASDMGFCNILAMKYGDDPDAIWSDYAQSAIFRDEWGAREADFRRLTIANAIAYWRKHGSPAPQTGDDANGMVVDRPKLLTEVGNARRLIESQGRNIRYCADDGCWLYFGGKVWLTDRKEVHLHDLMKRELIDMQKRSLEALEPLPDELAAKLTRNFTPKKISVPMTPEELIEAKEKGSKAETKKIDIVLTPEEQQLVENYKNAQAAVEWSQQSESSQKIRGSVEQARSEPGISVAKSALDVNTLVCNVENGRFAFAPETGEITFGKHVRSDLATKMMPVTYDPTADCPQFKAFISWMFPEKGVQEYVQTYLGLCLTGIIVRKILILYGEGANGKSTLMKVLYRMFGEVLDDNGSVIGQSYSQSVAFATFSVSRDETAGGARADLMPLKGARLITASESNKSSGKHQAKLDMARLKEMTGGDPTVARGMYQSDLTRFVNQGKIILQTNNVPAINDDSDGAWERLELLSCKSQIAEKDQDERLAEKLLAEAPGILNWLLEGLRMYFRQGLVETESMEADTEAYRGSENAMGRFVEEKCDIVSQETVRTPTSTLYTQYKNWCAENGEGSESQIALTQYLKRKFKVKDGRTAGVRYLCKIRLKAPTDSTAPTVEVDI